MASQGDSVQHYVRHVLLLVSHEPSRDPRCGWLAAHAPSGIQIHQLGISRVEGDRPMRELTGRGTVVWSYPRLRSDSEIGIVREWFASQQSISAVGELLAWYAASRLSKRALGIALGLSEQHARLRNFRWYLGYMLDMSLAILHHARALEGIHAVIATDLDTLAAAMLLKEAWGVPVIYDAHEFWPEADVDQSEEERTFWLKLEGRLLAGVDLAQTVSPGLANLMTRLYGTKFAVLPNAEPLSGGLVAPTPKHPSDSRSCRFLFQGGFARARGIDLLISAWPMTHSDAILELRGPNNEYKAEMRVLAKHLNLLGSRILFPDPVPEDRLVEAAARSDVGLIPYTPTGTNYSNSCPNKLSQYMAAGLPILANRTSFVETIVRKAECGEVIDFRDTIGLVAAVDRITNSVVDRARWGQNGHTYFRKEFHWEAVSREFYESLTRLISNQPLSKMIESKGSLRPFHGLSPYPFIKWFNPRDLRIKAMDQLRTVKRVLLRVRAALSSPFRKND